MLTHDEANAERRLIRRVLAQIDNVLATEDQHLLRTDGERLLTFAELRETIRVAQRLPILAGGRR